MQTLEFNGPPPAVCVFFAEKEFEFPTSNLVRFPSDLDEAWESEAPVCIFRMEEPHCWHVLNRSSMTAWLSELVALVASKLQPGDMLYTAHYNSVLGAAFNLQAMKQGSAPLAGRPLPVDLVAAFHWPAVLTFVKRMTFNCRDAADWLGWKPPGTTTDDKPWELNQQSLFMAALMQAIHWRSFEVPRV